MDENEARQVSHDGESDSFLDGWEETGPVQEETDPGGDGGKQAGEQEEDRADPGEDSQGGEDGQPGGEGDEGENPESQPSGGQRPFPPRNRAQIRADIQAFAAAFPEAAGNVGSIPREVWDAVNAGASLTAAYARYSGVQAAAEAARRRARQNARNAAASTGSMRSAGSRSPKDPFLEGWEEG